MKAVWNNKTVPFVAAQLLAFLFGGPVTSTLPNPNTPGPMVDFGPHEYQLVIDEGRRQHDNTVRAFEHVQARAQALLAVSLAVMALAVGSIGRLQDASGLLFVAAFVVFLGGLALVLTGLGLAAAVIVVRADFVAVDATRVSHLAKADIMRKLAEDYAESVRTGAITVADRVTSFRLATRYTVWGAALTGVVYMLTA